MYILHKSVRVAAMLGLLGIVLNGLWPLLATAEPRPAYFSSEICSVSSSKAAGSVAGKAPLQLPPPKHQNVHCVFCANGVCNASLEGAPLTVEALSTESQSVPPASAPGRKNTDAYLLAESRAPPRFRLL